MPYALLDALISTRHLQLEKSFCRSLYYSTFSISTLVWLDIFGLDSLFAIH